MEKWNKIAAVVVTYNRLKMLQQCVEALRSQSADCDILIVDNASSDETGLWLASVPDVFSRRIEKNRGSSGGFNYGMRWAVEAGYDYIWVMDDDTLPKTDALEKLLEADNILRGNYGWLGSVVLWTDGNECKMNRQRLKKSFYEYIPLMKYGLVQVEQATFVSLLFQSETLLRFGLPISEFYLSADDIELTRRIAVRGNVPCFMVGRSQVIHASKSNIGSNVALDDIERIERYFYAFRNEAYLYRQEGIKASVRCLARRCRDFLRILRFGKHKWGRLQILFRGIWAGFFFNPTVEMIPEKTEQN